MQYSHNMQYSYNTQYSYTTQSTSIHITLQAISNEAQLGTTDLLRKELNGNVELSLARKIVTKLETWLENDTQRAVKEKERGEE